MPPSFVAIDTSVKSALKLYRVPILIRLCYFDKSLQ